MKHLLNTFILVALCTMASIAQTKKDHREIKKTLRRFQRALMTWDIEKILYYTPPEVFEISPKILMEDLLQSNSEKFTLLKIKTKKIYPVMLYDGTKYALTEYTGQMMLKLSEEEKKNIEELATLWKQQEGAQNVILNKAKQQIRIRHTWRVCAMSTPGGKGWKFMQMSTDPIILDKVIPQQIQRKLREQAKEE